MNTVIRVGWRIWSSHSGSACIGKGASGYSYVYRVAIGARTTSTSLCGGNRTSARRSHNSSSHSYHLASSSVRVIRNIPPRVRIVEVGPRDGLQNKATTVSAKDKVQLVQMLAMAGCSHIEVGSFVSSKWVPTMANSIEVMQEIQIWRETASTLPSTSKSPVFSCLVPNMTGLQHAIQVGADEIAIFGSASESFSQKNINCSIEESMERFRAVTDMAKEHNIPIRGYLSCVIACPYEGPVAPKQVAKVAQAMLELGCYQLSLGDTIGVGTPGTVLPMLDALSSVVSGGLANNEDDLLAVHFHDTYGQGLVNLLVSLEQGITTVDSSVAGLGGCPYAKGASGNVSTEDVVYLLDGLGVDTGIDIDRLVDAAEFICSVLKHPSRSRAGLAIAAKR